MQAEKSGIARLVESTVGDERFEKALYRRNSGTLSEREEEWERFHRIANLPITDLEGWEELLVYTDQSVYRWVETGFGSNPTRLPRHPDSAIESTS